MKSEIRKLRKKIFKNLKMKAYSFEAENVELTAYLNDQIKYSKRKFDIITMEELSKKVLASSVIYLGDFHTFDQNIRNVLRIVKLLLSEQTNCILGLEMVSHEHQLYIDAYMERHLTELEFLESINYRNSWRFPWTHYKLIFDLAKTYNLKVIGLNTEGSLAQRDEFAALRLKETHKENPKAKLLVLYGELHITKNKIPALMKKHCPRLTHTIIHQNLDEVYWKLTKSDLEQGIVSFSKNEFCIVSAPPWIKYESMIYWYENLCDDPDFDIHEYIIETGAKIFIDDTKENFLNICSELIKHLDLSIDPVELEDFNLYDHTHLEFIEGKLETTLKPSLLVFFQYLISSNKSFHLPLPEENTFYCSSYSMNRISYLAGIHIFHYYFQNQKSNSYEVLNSKSKTNKFILFCYESMYAFFFSKVINPHRKCDMYLDIQMNSVENSLESLTLELIDSDDIGAVLTGKKLTTIYEVALLVGHILGEYLYLSIKNEESQKSLKDFLESSTISKKTFHELKRELLEEQDYQNHVKRYF